MKDVSTALRLPAPRLSEGLFSSLTCYTDEALWQATGVRVAFTTRTGGVSEVPYQGLNLGDHVGDDPAAVAENRKLLMASLGFSACTIANPKQVHGDVLVSLDDEDALQQDIALSRQGADGLVVSLPNVAALLCYADCVPVIIVAPDGRFAVVHAGWRGVVNGIAVAALRQLSDPFDPDQCNIYLGPYIHGECFETGDDVHQRFFDLFGAECVYDDTHIDLGAALRVSLVAAGADPARIVEVGGCTMCHPERWFTYRGEGGVCGRHGAVAIRKEGDLS